jgi:hypothetical protein
MKRQKLDVDPGATKRQLVLANVVRDGDTLAGE